MSGNQRVRVNLGPAEVDVDGYRRDGRSLTLRYDVDVSGRAWEAQMRRTPTSDDPIDLDVSSANGGLDVVIQIPDAVLVTTWLLHADGTVTIIDAATGAEMTVAATDESTMLAESYLAEA